MVLDSSSNRALMAKTFDEAVEIIDCIAKNNSEWEIDYPMSCQITMHQKVAVVVESDHIFALNAHIQAVQMMLKNLACVNPINSTTSPIANVCIVPHASMQQLF